MHTTTVNTKQYLTQGTGSTHLDKLGLALLIRDLLYYFNIGTTVN